MLEEVGYEPGREHQIESRLAISNGYLGVRASLASPTRTSRPRTFVAGLFDASSSDPLVPALVPAPDWLGLRVYFADETGRRVRGDWPGYKRTLDLRHGSLYSEWRQQSREGYTVRVRAMRFVSLAERSLGIQVAEIEAEGSFTVSLEAWIEETWAGLKPGVTQSEVTIWRTPHTGSHLAVGSRAVLQRNGRPLISEPRNNGGQGERWTWTSESGERVLFQRLVAMVRGEPPEALAEHTQQMLLTASRTGVLGLLKAHNRAWEERWAASEVEVEGDPVAQRALRFAIYHLISAANPDDDCVSIGARALTGDAYAGHVFWDTEIFLLPFYIFTWPAAARALLMYRHYTLPAAREKAHQLGYRGAFYAWESAGDGVEATPPYVFGPDGRAIVIQNAEQEIHISADVAYAVWQYWIATGDDDYFVSAGAEIIVETARFYASRAELDDDGRYHIPKVIGPDEYHEGVDDNAYTNFMAQWNLERALEVADLLASRWPQRWTEFDERLGVTPEEIRAWEDVASRLVTGIDPSSGLIEQFAGFFDLDPIYVSGYASRHAAMDVVLGMDRTRRSQVNKQADVVMLIALLWDRFSSQVREANFRYYEARCGHGSSLSPSMHGLVAAREGDVGLAQRYFEQAAAIDFDDSMGNAALGVHIAALGGLWQVAVFGFAGLILAQDGLRFDPHLPESWGSLRFPVQWRGRHLRVSITERGVCFAASLQEGEPMWVYLGDLQHKLKPGEPWTCRWDDAARQWQPM